MKSLLLALNFFLLLLLSACQVKEQTSAGNLVSGHVNVTNKFTLTTPSAKTYVSGETLSLVLSFPFNITVTGTPRLVLNVGGSTVYADYVSGDQSSTLVFQYTFIVSDNDSDGVALTSLDLNGGSLTFDASGVLTNCNTATVTTRTFSNVRVDNTVPAPTAFTLNNLPGFYNKDDRFDFLVTFNEAVVVTGTPRILLDFLGGAATYATYSGGSGTTVLGFSLTITNDIWDTNAFDVVDSLIGLNGGTIKDSVGNNATLSLAAFNTAVRTYSASTTFDGRVPYVVSVTPPANGTYDIAQVLEFVVEYDRPVNVTGSPYIGITIPAGVRQALYATGSGTNLIRFRYTTVPGDVDTNGIAVATTITANGGTIAGSTAPTNSYFTPAANNSFTVPPTTGVILNSVQPQPVSVSRNVDSTLPTWGGATPDNIWNIGQELLISVAFNTNMYVNQVSGTPRIPITIGATQQYATYLSGGNGQTTLVFRYLIQVGDLDSDGSIAIGSIDLNGGNITDVANTNSLLPLPVASLTTTRIDGVRPVIASVAAPANGSYSLSSPMNFTVTWSEAVNYSSAALNLPLTIGATARNAPYISGTNSTTIIHRPDLTGQNDADGIAMASPMTGAAIIRDQAGNTATDLTYTPPVTTGILVDTVLPTLVSFTPPAAGTYVAGDDLDFTIVFSEPVNVIQSGGFPRFPLALTSSTRYATYLSGTGTNTIIFRYTVVASDSDLNGITNPTALTVTAPAYIRDLALNSPASFNFAANLAGIIIDALPAAITGRTIPANGTYDAGDTLTFTTTYNENVTVSGVPSINVPAQTGTLNFDYVSGSGSSVLTYSYTITSDDFDFDGLGNTVSTVTLNGGTIQDAALNDAGLTFTAANLVSVFIAYPDTRVWSISTFANRSAIAGLTVTSTGAITTQACGTGTCRTFSGDDSFNLGVALTNAEEVFIVFKAPPTLTNLDLLSTDIALVNDGAAMDLVTTTADINLNGNTTSGTNHDVNMSINSVHIMHAVFSSPPNYGAGALINTAYRGGIGEVIIVTSPLTPTQRNAILTYLNNKF